MTLRRIVAAIVAASASLCIALALTFNWAYSEGFTTSRFVATANKISEDPSVQAEISHVLVTAFFADTSMPSVLLAPLEEGAKALVASDAFHTFWSNALWDIHEPLVKQLKSDSPIDSVTATRIDLTSFVNTLLTELRTQYPKFATVLPKTAPLTEFQLLDGARLESARKVVRILTLTRWAIIVLAVVLLSATALLSRKKVQPLRAPLSTISVGAFATTILTFLIPKVATSFVGQDHADTARSIATEIAEPLRTQSLAMMALGIVVLIALALRNRRKQSVTP